MLGAVIFYDGEFTSRKCRTEGASLTLEKIAATTQCAVDLGFNDYFLGLFAP